MKYITLIIIILGIAACESPLKLEETLPPAIDWSARKAVINTPDSLMTIGSTYLPIYSEIYQRNKNFTFDLTATVSIRNISLSDTLFIYKADYYNTHGELLRSYIKEPVYVIPMETLEIVVSEDDKEGGSGANFIFDWSVKQDGLIPFFEAVMISTSGQQGVSFTTHGIRKK